MQQEIIKVPILKTNFETEKKLSAFEIFQDAIVKFIRSLDQNKAHDYDEILIRVLKQWATSISKPLQIH